MTCEEQFKSRTSQAYKDCVAQRKAEEIKLAKGLPTADPETIELDEVIVEGKIVQKPVEQKKISRTNVEGLEIIEDDVLEDKQRDAVEKASYIVNSFSPFTVDPDSGNFWQDSKTWLSDLENKASTLANTVDIAANTAGNILKLENLKFENLKGEKEAFRVIGENLNSNIYEEIDIPTYNAVQKLALEQLIFKKKQNLTASELNDPENYMPTAMEIWAETNFLFQKALPYASQEKTTIVDLAAQAANINPNNGVVDYISDFYGYARNGWLIGDEVQPIYDMFNSVGDEQTLASTRNYIAKNANTIALNYTSDEYLNYQKDILKNVESGDGNWWSITKALYDNPSVLLTTGLQSLTMNASNVINAEGARERGVEAALEGAAATALTTKNPYAAGVGTIAGFGAGTMEFLELNMTAMETLDELIREEGLGESITDLDENEILDLLGNKKKMKEVLRISKNRSKIISAGTFITAMMSFGAGKVMTAKGISTLKTLATLGIANVPAEMAIEGLALQAQGKDLRDVKSVEEMMLEGFSVDGVTAIASLASTTKAVNQSNINRKAKKIAVENGFSLADVFSGKANGTGVEIIKTGIDQGQMQLSLSSLIQNKEITINEAKEILTNFNDLKTFVGQTKDLVKKFGFNDSQTARISEILSELKENQKLINQYKDAPALTAPLVKANAELNNELDSIIATGGITEGVELEEVVVTGKNKKEQSVRGKKIDSLAGEKGKDGKYKIKRKEWYNPKTKKGKSEDAIVSIFTENDPVTNQPGLLNSIIASKITLQMEQLPGFSSEDFISQTIAELIPHIRNFNPEQNDSLNGWIIPQINNKIKNALKGGKSGTKEKFESSIQSGSVEGKEIQIEDDSTQESIDAEVQTEPIKVIGDMLADMAGVDSETTSAAASQTIKSPIEIEKKGSPRQAVKDVSAIGKAKFYEMVMEAFGGPLGTKGNKIGNFTTFLEANGVNILRILENEDGIKNNQLSGLYGPKKVGRSTGKFDKGAGKGVFTYNNPKPTTQDLISFLTDPNTGMTTLRNRQEKFADIIAGLLNRAKTKELGDTKEGKKVLKETQSIVNPDVPEAVEKILSQIDIVVKKLDAVGENQLGSGVSPALIANLLSGGLKLLKSGIKGTVSLAQALGRLKRTIAAKAKNSTLADIITRYFVDKATTGKINEINEASVSEILTEFAVVTGDVNVLLTKYDQAQTFKLDTPESIDAYLKDFITKLAPFIPRGMIFKGLKGMGVLRTSDRTAFGNKGNLKEQLKKAKNADVIDKKKIKELEAKIKAGILNEKYYQSKIKELKAGEIVLNGENIKVNWGDDLKNPDGSIMTDYSQSTYESIIGTLGKIKKGIADGSIKTWDDKNVSIFNQMWDRLNMAIKKDKTASSAIGNYLSLVGNDINHWHKMGASFIAYSNDLKPGEAPRMEHAMVATGAYIYLLDAILSGKNFTTEKEKIMANYKLAAIKIKADDLINKVKVNGKTALKTKMTPGWILETGQWFDRYFNILVAALGGIDPKSMTMVDTGKTVAETYNITFDGRPELVINEANNKSVDKIAEGQSAVENNPNLIPKEPVNLSKDFNIILEETEGIGQEKVYSDIGARKSGVNKGKYKFFMPPSAQDFELLMYNFLGKGKLGEKQKKFFVDNLMKPYSKGIAKMEIYRAQLMNDFEALKKLLPEVSKKLGDKIKGLDYTNSQAIRVFLWDKSNLDIPGISKTDKNKLISFVKKNPDLKEFAEGLTALSKQPEWVKPNAYWDTGSIIQDVNRLSSTVGRKQQLEQFIKNADIIFSKENLNKIEAVYGVELKEALQDILYRMKNGTNRPSNADRLTNAFTNWLNNAVGAIMFFNRRSATLQLLSMLNYVNAQENNPLAIAKSVLNVKQYGKDIYTILSSPKIKKRFAGEGRGVNEAEISSAVSTSTNKASALLSYLLKVGFTPTRAADAAAIALGGASYYRNKINAYKKQGLSDKDAETKAWEDFSDTTEKISTIIRSFVNISTAS